VHPSFIALELFIFDRTTILHPVPRAIMVADNVRCTWPNIRFRRYRWQKIEVKLTMGE